ncbi:MAG: hypothetical protein NW201_07235 [Gemmatimonadales bacterium]|nr:hypothetical protein [Gemmatimonadales bacterium]
MARPLADARLQEASGVAPSAAHPGRLWSLNDSGNPPELFLTDTLGRALGRWRVKGAENLDWEDLAIGPCATARGRCLHIADIGDNRGARRAVRLYRVPEPHAVPAPDDALTARAEALTVTYPDGPDDAEAAYVTPAGDVVIITKGRRGAFAVLRVPASAWRTPGVPARAEAVGRLPLSAPSRDGQLVTGAALSPDGRALAVRSYEAVYRFATDARGLPSGAPSRCAGSGGQRQGEGIAWVGPELVALVGEASGPQPPGITVVRCPSPPQ